MSKTNESYLFNNFFGDILIHVGYIVVIGFGFFSTIKYKHLIFIGLIVCMLIEIIQNKYNLKRIMKGG